MEFPPTVNVITAAPLLTWTVCLARMQPRRTIVVLICILITGLSGFFVLGPLSGFVAVLVLFAALTEFLAPVRFAITPEYAEIHTITNKRRVMWDEVASCTYSDKALLVSTVNQTSPLYLFRGITLHFDNNADAVIECVRRIRSGSA